MSFVVTPKKRGCATKEMQFHMIWFMYIGDINWVQGNHISINSREFPTRFFVFLSLYDFLPKGALELLNLILVMHGKSHGACPQ